MAGGTEKEKNLEIGPDRRPLWRQNHGTGQIVNLLWKLGMESVQVSFDGMSNFEPTECPNIKKLIKYGQYRMSTNCTYISTKSN